MYDTPEEAIACITGLGGQPCSKSVANPKRSFPGLRRHPTDGDTQGHESLKKDWDFWSLKKCSALMLKIFQQESPICTTFSYNYYINYNYNNKLN